MTARLSPTVRRRRLGVELRRLREEAGLTIEQVAKKLECSDSKVSRIETGQVGAMPRDVRDMLELYGVGDEQRDALVQIAREARRRGWWHSYGDVPVVPAYIGLEVAAATVDVYGALLVPGLLQTRQYAAAVLRAVRPDLPPEQIERRVELRVARQSILDRDDPPELWTILDEAVLRRPVGGPTIMREQFRHLIGMAAQPKVTIQVLPFTVGAHTGVDGPFTIFGFSTPTDPDVVHLEHTMGDLYLERPEEITRYALAFRGLRDAALRPDASAAFLTDLLGR